MGARLSRTPGPILSGDPYQLKFLHRSYEVHSFLSSEDALQSLRAGFTPSALVVDLALPEMDGFVFLETLLKEGLAPGAPRLILTNQTKPAEPSMRKPKKQPKPFNDLSRSLIPFDPNQTLTGVVELSKKTWLVAGIIPGVERQPLKKLAADENELLKLLERWRGEAEKAGHKITRIAVAFETGRDGFWLARWLKARGIEAHVIHAASVPVSREHRRAKTDRLDTEQLKRAFLGWLRGERNHCKMATILTFAEEDAKRPHRERETLVGEQTTIINRIKATLARLGIRSFNPKLKTAPERLEHVRTPEGEPIPPNTLAELRRDMERKQLVAEQIRQIEKARLEQLRQAPKARPNLMVLCRHTE